MEITQKILDQIKAYQKIMIHRHQSPDPDALGSQGGLAEILRASFPEKEIYVVGGPVNDLGYLITMDDVSDEMYQGALVISTDTANAPRISGEQYKLGEYLLKIDHHPNDEPYGDLSWISTEASSTSEMIYDFFSYHQDELTISHTLLVASKLREYPFDASKLNRQIDEISVKIARLSGYVTENIQVDENGAAMVLLTQEVLDKFDVVDSETPAIISVPGRIKDIQAWGIFVAQPEGKYRVRLRSKGPIINTIAKRHDGGGHPLASGANAQDLDEVKAIYEEIQAAVKSESGL